MVLVDNETEKGPNAPELAVGFEVGRYLKFKRVETAAIFPSLKYSETTTSIVR